MRALAILAVAGAAALAACSTPVSAATQAAWRPVPGARITCHSAVQRDDLDAAVLDVAAAGPAQAWAVGVCGADGGTHDFVGQAPTGFVEHWDGRRWSRVTVPASGEYDVVQAGSPRDVWVASLAGDPWAAGQAGSPAAMPGGANVIHWNGRRWAVAQLGLARSASVYALAATAGIAWMLAYLRGATTVLHWTGAAWRPVAGPAGFRFATTPQPPAADPAGGGFLAGGGGRIWLGGENGATRPVIAQRAGSGWVTIRVPVTSTYGWIGAMAASGRSLWVRVEESGNAHGPGWPRPVPGRSGWSWLKSPDATVAGRSRFPRSSPTTTAAGTWFPCSARAPAGYATSARPEGGRCSATVCGNRSCCRKLPSTSGLRSCAATSSAHRGLEHTFLSITGRLSKRSNRSRHSTRCSA